MQALNIKVSVLVDPLSVLMANVAACVGTLIMIYSVNYMAKEDGLPRYYFFMLLFVGGMIGLVIANNLLQMYMFWETVGLCSYALIGFWYRRSNAVKAGTKAFIVTRIGDIFLLIGILLIYVNTGTFDFLEVKTLIATGRATLPMLAISTLMFIGAIGKSAQVPLHVWLPNAMEGPTPVSALIHAATMVKAGIYLVARIYILFSLFQPWLMSISYIGGITALIAATMALVSSDMKRVLAFSTISQLGMIMAVLGIGTEFSWFASQFHVVSHALFKSLLFLSAGAIMHAIHTLDLEHMGGLRKSMPVTFIVSIIGVFSLAGLPPFNGFWSKDTLFESILMANNYPVFVLVAATSVLTVVYSLRWICLIFLGEKSEFIKRNRVRDPHPIILIPLIVLSFFSCISGFFRESFQHYMAISHTTASHISLLAQTSSAVILGVGVTTAYLIYYKKRVASEVFRRNFLSSSLHRLVANGFYFDAVYYKLLEGVLGLARNVYGIVEMRGLERVPYLIASGAFSVARGTHGYIDAFLDRLVYLLAGGAVKTARGTHGYVDAFLDRLCYLIAGGTMKTARGTHKHIDTLLDRLVYLIAGKTALHGRKIKKIHRGPLPDFVLAAAIGFFLLIILLLSTALR
jgi:NADH-quinone oxidoreductase subunit L